MAESSLVGSKTNVISSILAFETRQIKGSDSLKSEKPKSLEVNNQNMTSKMLRSTYGDGQTGSTMSVKKILESTISISLPNICASATNHPTHIRFSSTINDPEPGRCRRTDGKKWRCAREVVVDQKYCERHLNRGRYRSKKHVECHSTSNCVSVSSTDQNASTPLSSSSSTSMVASSRNAQSTINAANIQRRPKRFQSSTDDSISNDPRKWISRKKDKMFITRDLAGHGLFHTNLQPPGAKSSLNETLSPIFGSGFHSRFQSTFTNTHHRNLSLSDCANNNSSSSLDHDQFHFKESGHFSRLEDNKRLQKSSFGSSHGINVQGLVCPLGFNGQTLYGASSSSSLGLSAKGNQVIQVTKPSCSFGHSQGNEPIVSKSTSIAYSLNVENMGPYKVLRDDKLSFDNNCRSSNINDDLEVHSRVYRSSPTCNGKGLLYGANIASSEFKHDQLQIPSQDFDSYSTLHCESLGSSDLNNQGVLLPLVHGASELNDSHQVYPKNIGFSFGLNELNPQPQSFRGFHGHSDTDIDQNLGCFGLSNDNSTIMRLGNDIGWNGIEDNQYEPDLLSPSIPLPFMSSSSAPAKVYKDDIFSLPQSSWLGFQQDNMSLRSYVGSPNDEPKQSGTNAPANSWDNPSYWGPLGEIFNAANKASQAHQSPSLHPVDQFDAEDHEVPSGTAVANEIGISLPPIDIVGKANDEAPSDDVGEDFVGSIVMNSPPPL